MKTSLRSLFVWLLLLALPFQGVAAARMLPSTVATGTTVAAAAMMAPMPGHCALHAPAKQPHAASHDGHGAHGSACAACCIGVALAPAALAPLAFGPPDFIAIPFRPGHVTSADPALPERPPRTRSA